jgi:RimJ/RimL family protein N-acetyltransferase
MTLPTIQPLETERLLLRPLELADEEPTQRLFPDWDIVRYLTHTVPWPYPNDGALAFYRDVALPKMRAGDAWFWSLRLKSSPDQLIGVIALFRGEDNNRGFWIGRPWQQRGLMTEASEAVTAYWFDTLGFSVLRVPKAVANKGSRRISEKGGMRLVATTEKDYVSGRLPTEIWEITADEWRRWRERKESCPASITSS